MKVEIWSDVVCPWCYIGKRRFERALEQVGFADEVTVTYRSFELDPDAPTERTGNHAEHLAAKYGMSVAQAEQANRQMTERAAEEGLEFRFDIMRGGNTFDAHRLLHFAAEHGRQEQLKERLLQATFAEGQPIADRDVLASLAGEVGLDEAASRAVLDSGEHADAVRIEEQAAHDLGITGVPFFVIDRKYGISGAQPTELFVQALEQAHAESRPLQVISPEPGNAPAACDGDSCAI